MERWTEVNKGMIPNGNYLMHLQCGNAKNFTVFLESDKFEITLEFSRAMSFHCVDESRWLFLPYDMEAFSYYQKKKFDNVLYRIHGGEYFSFSKKYVEESFKDKRVIHYILVILNYFLEVINLGVINVTVKNLETGESQKYVVDGTEG